MALDLKGKTKKKEENGVPYYVAKRNKCIVVVPGLGHLYTVAGKKRGQKGYPVFDFRWIPRYLAERGASRTHTWLKVISKLAETADKFVDACDYDIEGSIIGHSILKYACNGKENTAQRMKYSTLTKEEIEKSYTEMLPSLDFALVEAGLTRHEVDWLYGINLSRALTRAAKNYSGKYVTLSTGRVQGPTLKFLEARERSIKCFVPTPYWSIKAKVILDRASFIAKYEKNPVVAKTEAETITNNCRKKDAIIEKVSIKKFQEQPPLPFDLGSLQSEAYRLFRYTPIRTLKIAQSLYLAALISYPRTSSQKLPPTIDYKAILKNISRIPKYKQETQELLAKSALKPIEGKKMDPAHPAIYPTGNQPESRLSSVERKIWELVIRRFMSVFVEPAQMQITEAVININDNRFQLKGKRILKEGWLRFYSPYAKSEYDPLPLMEQGEEVSVEQIMLENNFTTPPSRYNPSSLLKRMEKEEIGTKTTRAGVIQTLNSRKYIRGERMVVTDLGFEVIDVLKKYCPIIVTLDLTRKLEKRLNEIQQGNETGEEVLHDTIEILKPVTKQLKEKEHIIGARLSQALMKALFKDRLIGMCPVCKNGKLLILHSKKTRKRFIGCTNYFEGKCKTSFPLPQKGETKSMGIICKSCGWVTVRILIRGNRSWNFCFNPECPSKEERRKKSEM